MLKLKYPVPVDADGLPIGTPPNRDAAFISFRLERLAPSGLVARATQWALGLLMPLVLGLVQRLGGRWRIGRLLILTRHADVVAALQNHADFAVPFRPEMTMLTAGLPTFMLGEDGPLHDQQKDAILPAFTAARPAFTQTTERVSRQLIDNADGRIDVMRDYVTRVAVEAAAAFLGIRPDDPDQYGEWTLAASGLIFADPLGNPTVRELAVHAGWRMRGLMDHDIDRARQYPATATGILGELVRTTKLTDHEIRAILIGLSIGLIPTMSLAAGKLMGLIARRPDIRAATIAAARAGDDSALEAVLAEALRLSPPLNPGQFRIARHDCEFDGLKIEKDVVVLTATATAVRDPAVFDAPGRFRPDRPRPAPNLLFGAGSHYCFGDRMAMQQMVALFGRLFRLPDIAFAAGAEGRLQQAGAFPLRMDLVWTPARGPAGQAMVTIAIPVSNPTPARHEALVALLEGLGNPASPAWRQALDASGVVHFASLAAVDVGRSDAPDLVLMVELSVDGTAEHALGRLAKHAGTMLAPVLAHVDRRPDEPIDRFLLRHRLHLHQRPWGVTGLDYNGSAEFPLADKARQAALADFADQALDLWQRQTYGQSHRPMAVIAFLHRLIANDPDGAWDVIRDARPGIVDPIKMFLTPWQAQLPIFADMLVLPSRKRLAFVDWRDRTDFQKWMAYLGSGGVRPILIGLAGLLILAAFVVGLGLGLPTPAGRIGWLITGAIVALLFLLLAAAGIAIALWHQLRRLEQADIPDERPPDPARLDRLVARENPPGHVQNHILSVSAFKPSLFRRLTFAFALWGIGLYVRFWARPGFVLTMGTIHYARWFRLPGAAKLIFYSNYDGSWESYLEDFITRAHIGQTAAWTHGEGFPRTVGLTGEGARDGARFKRWTRRQQQEVQSWYSRFPHLTLDRIRTNALIHDGLARATSDSAARAWLACFGSQQRPDAMVESDEVQTLLFRGLPSRPWSHCLLIRLPDSRQAARAILSDFITGNGVPSISFGEMLSGGSNRGSLAYVALSAAGLRHLALGEDALADFPHPFAAGMAARRSILGDRPDALSRWSDQTVAGAPVHLWVQALADNEGTLDRDLKAIRRRVEGPASRPATDRGRILHIVRTAPILVPEPPDPCKQESEEKPVPRVDVEHFGYRDGLSQPAIRGTVMDRRQAARDLMAPGEFLLGYRANDGNVAPSPAIPRAADPRDWLPDTTVERASRFPAFRKRQDEASPFRDFGRNGSFLVVRQLVQDKAGFERALADEANRLKTTYPNLGDTLSASIDAEWVAAKLMGRWRDGTPLYERMSHRPAGRRRTIDNDFGFAEEDPRGLHCPLGAHIRRANPRDSLIPDDPRALAISNRHRIVRRGRTYDTGSEQGMMFIALCADIERQFEFIQQQWLAAPNFHGLPGETDPITTPADPAAPASRFTVPTASGPLRLQVQHYATPVAGGYFFLPSRAALRYLADPATA